MTLSQGVGAGVRTRCSTLVEASAVCVTSRGTMLSFRPSVLNTSDACRGRAGGSRGSHC